MHKAGERVPEIVIALLWKELSMASSSEYTYRLLSKAVQSFKMSMRMRFSLQRDIAKATPIYE